MPASPVTPGDDVPYSNIALHKRETKGGSGYWSHPGICTVTFCEGDPKLVLESLRPKVKAVAEANPWIAGKLTTAPKQLAVPAKINDAIVSELLSMVKDPAVNRKQQYPALVKATGANKALTVQTGSKSAKLGLRICKCVVVEPESTGGEFALIFSMSHVAADGHDYYKIFDMIAGSAPIEAMSPMRVAEYEACEPEWTGNSDFKWISGGGGLIKGMLAGLLCGPKSQWCCYTVDDTKVAAAKAQAARDGGVAFCSTNDVLTSHFCKAAACRVGMMVINMRNKIRLPITDAHAGCYEMCLLLDPANYADPAKIRKCISAGAPYTRQAPSPKLPGFCSSCPMALITSWASFPFEIKIEGIDKQVLHLPCMAIPDMMDVAIAFKPQPGKLGMLYLAKRAKPHTLMAPGTPLGATVDENLFPVK